MAFYNIPMAYYYYPRSIPGNQNSQISQGKDYWILVLIVLLFFISVVIIVTIIHFFPDYISRRRHRSRVDNTLELDSCQSVDIDATAIASLPTFIHGSNDGNSGGEGQCTVCLSAVKEGEVMKLLPNCKHLFHAECIDMWLHSHSTCPICRTDVKRWWWGQRGGQLLASLMMPARAR